ncbi:MAG: hypothetical protein R2734_11940 [Nocardioides sp.]
MSTTPTTPRPSPASWPGRAVRPAYRRRGRARAQRRRVSSGGVIAAAGRCSVADPGGRGRLWSTLNTVLVNWRLLAGVIVGASGARLLSYNEHPHLAGPLVTYR